MFDAQLVLPDLRENAFGKRLFIEKIWYTFSTYCVNVAGVKQFRDEERGTRVGAC